MGLGPGFGRRSSRRCTAAAAGARRAAARPPRAACIAAARAAGRGRRRTWSGLGLGQVRPHPSPSPSPNPSPDQGQGLPTHRSWTPRARSLASSSATTRSKSASSHSTSSAGRRSRFSIDIAYTVSVPTRSSPSTPSTSLRIASTPAQWPSRRGLRCAREGAGACECRTVACGTASLRFEPSAADLAVRPARVAVHDHGKVLGQQARLSNVRLLRLRAPARRNARADARSRRQRAHEVASGAHDKPHLAT